MANTVTNTNNLSLRSILEKDKLTGPNFLDWECNLMIVLRHERKWYVLEEPLGGAPPANAPTVARNAHKKHSDDLLDVGCLMLATMSPDLQTGVINTNAYDMIRQLRDMFQTQARTERYDATKAFNECKMIRGTSVSDHVMKMKRHMDHLERLGHPVPLQQATDTILNSLSEDYKPFVINYNMNNMEKSIVELHSMLKTAELNMGAKNKTKDVLMVRDGGVKKKHGHGGTNKGNGPVQAVQSAPKVRENIKGKGKGKKVKPNKARTENRCFTCNEIGHWRQNCQKRHEAENSELVQISKVQGNMVKYFLAPKTAFLLPKTDDFLQKTNLQQNKEMEYSRNISEAGFVTLAPRKRWLAPREDYSRREEEARAAKLGFSLSEASRRLGFDRCMFRSAKTPTLTVPSGKNNTRTFLNYITRDQEALQEEVERLEDALAEAERTNALLKERLESTVSNNKSNDRPLSFQVGMNTESDDGFWDELELFLQEDIQTKAPKEKQPIDKPATKRINSVGQLVIQPEVSCPNLEIDNDSNEMISLGQDSHQKMEVEDTWFGNSVELSLQEDARPNDKQPIEEPPTRMIDSMDQTVIKKPWPPIEDSWIQHEVLPPWSDSDDSDEEFSWQVNATEEYFDDDCLDGLGVLMQDDQFEESPPEQCSPKQKVSSPIIDSNESNTEALFSQVNPRAVRCEEILAQDPFWEANCQKQLVDPTILATHLKDLRPNSCKSDTHSAKKQDTNQSGEWHPTLPGKSPKGKSSSQGSIFFKSMASKRHRMNLRTASGKHEFIRFGPHPQHDRQELTRDLKAIKGRHIEIGRTLDWDFLQGIQAAGHILRYFERGPNGPESELSSMAWKTALDLRESVYRELTLEFIATYSFDEERGRESVRQPCIQYRLGGRWFRQSLAQFVVSFRLYTAGMVGTNYFEYYIGQCDQAPPEDLDYSELWSQLGHGPYRRSNTKSGGLVDPEHRVLHRMIAYTLNQRKSSQDKIGDFELWLLHQLVSRDRHTHLAYIIVDFLTGARGFRTSSGLLGGHYITRLASSHGILTPEVTVSLTCLGELGRIYQHQLKGMRVIERGVGSSWVWIVVEMRFDDKLMR
ncbi:hypothetical protein OSB04_017054 [Centaurea solstitialis]|uniref:CCHC-type domain-containing protein n=1 Tax=Centaurea solstitialis TaxID=347529 RepID=A0AA38WKD0_9ASTR|nr:hypothetical protein OSB04_017054 [Centaurea solstitialis]